MIDSELTKRICAVLGLLPGWAWSETEPYAPDVVGVYYGRIDSEPNRAVGVRAYDTEDYPDLDGRRVQLRSRGDVHDPAGADDIADAAKALLEGLSRYQGISHVTHLSFAPLGADESGREERTDNFIITLDNEEA